MDSYDEKLGDSLKKALAQQETTTVPVETEELVVEEPVQESF